MKTAKEITSLLGVAALLLFANWLKAPDVPDLVAAHEAEVAAEKEAAKIESHRKAVRLREQGLLDESNFLMYLIAQIPDRK